MEEEVEYTACAKKPCFGPFLRHCTSFTRCSAAGSATRLELRGFFWGLLCQTEGPGERWRRRWESVPGVGPLAK